MRLIVAAAVSSQPGRLLRTTRSGVDREADRERDDDQHAAEHREQVIADARPDEQGAQDGERAHHRDRDLPVVADDEVVPEAAERLEHVHFAYSWVATSAAG